MTAGILLAGLWPFRFSAQNNARWLSDTNGLRFLGAEALSAFDPGGEAFTPQPLSVPAQRSVEAGSLTIEMALRPAKEPMGAKGRILSVAGADGREAFFVGQWSTELLLFVPESGGGNPPRFREIDLRDALKAGQPRFVTITSDRAGTVVHLNGQRVLWIPGVSLLAPTATLAGQRLFVGNAPDGLHPWAGDVFGLSLYGRLLTDAQVRESRQWWSRPVGRPPPAEAALLARYDFTGSRGRWIHDASGSTNALFIPEVFARKKHILTRIDSAGYDWRDIVVNVLGFVPYGFFLALWLARLGRSAGSMPLLLAVLAGGLVSLAIELIQVYLPMRDSSLADLVCNVAGSLAGALGARWWGRSGG